MNVLSSINHTTAVQELQNGFASAAANSVPPATTPPIPQASGGREKLAAMSGMKVRLLQAFDAQRAESNTQAGPSNNPRLEGDDDDDDDGDYDYAPAA